MNSIEGSTLRTRIVAYNTRQAELRQDIARHARYHAMKVGGILACCLREYARKHEHVARLHLCVAAAYDSMGSSISISDE
jgi:phage-related baseplate assembly protein